MQGQQKELAMIAVCEDCQFEFKVSTLNLESMREINIQGNKLYLTFYLCPMCSRVHFVQIDDDETKRQLRLLEMMVGSSMVKPKGQRKYGATQIKKAQVNLSECRTALMKLYTGVEVVNPNTTKAVPLVFSILQ